MSACFKKDLVKRLERYSSEKREDTVEIAAAFAATLKKGDIVCLYGDLGAGKTAFVAGVAQAFGYKGYTSSPTFTLLNEYLADLPIYHFDVYRIGSSDEMYEVGIDDYLFGEGVCLIEWPERVEDLLPESVIRVRIEKNGEKGDDYREITIERGRAHENSCA